MAHYHPLQEELVNLLTIKTQSNQTHFFRLLVAYHFTKMASTMRVNIQTEDRGVIPVNMYCLNLAVSGAGKGHSTNIMEELITSGFKDKFLEDTLPNIGKQNLQILANDRAVRDNVDPDTWLGRLNKEYESLGNYAWSFDSATTPAIKQFRQKLLLSSIGSMNLEMDEIGSNFLSNLEVLATFLELFDKGLVKQKLTKNTQENLRYEEVAGYTPTNMMLFGTPVKLLDGHKTEEDFKQALETGYARRIFVGYSNEPKKMEVTTGAELYQLITSTSLQDTVDRVHAYFKQLGSQGHINPVISIAQAESIQLLDYKIGCEKKAAEFPDHMEVFEAEMSHRYYKALKLAGVYAFIDKERQIKSHHLKYAIQIAEDSGENFERMMNKDGPYVQLARYLANCKQPQTHVDLMENLHFFRGSKQDKQELMNLASAYGCRNNISIKRDIVEGVEFLSGEALTSTNLDRVLISHSQDITEGFMAENAPFDKLHMLVCGENFHYCAHEFEDGYRHRNNVVPGFDLIILDMDDGTKLDVAMRLLEGYRGLYATTKRHTPGANRFRIVLPMSHRLHLESDDYTQFMENLFQWLPFTVDSQTKDIARKWESFPGQYHYTDGELIDATMFIPKTHKQERQQQKLLKAGNKDRLQRWFADRIKVGNRSNMLLRYGHVLLDSGISADDACEMLLEFNKKLPAALNKREIEHTICKTLQRRELQN